MSRHSDFKSEALKRSVGGPVEGSQKPIGPFVTDNKKTMKMEARDH